MKYGKLTNNNIEYSPYRIVFNDMAVYNPSEDKLRQLGYKPVIETPQPKANNMVYYYYWVEEEDQIVQHWQGREIKVEQPVEYPELFELQERILTLDLENKLAIAELAELILGGNEND